MEENNVKTWVVWLFAFISVIIIGGLCFWIGTQFSHKNDVTVNEKTDEKLDEKKSWTEENEVISLASDYDHLYLIQNNKSTVISNIDRESSLYVYDNEKVYVSQYSYETRSSEIGYYDLLNKNEYHELFHPEVHSSPESIMVLDNHVYVTFNREKEIVDYNIDTKEIKKLSYFEDYFKKLSYGSFLLFKTSSGKVLYWTRGTTNVDAQLGEIDLKTGEKRLIASDVYLEYVYENKAIYRQYLTINGKGYAQYYEYDISNNKAKEISDKKVDIGGAISYSLIVPYKDYYVYAYQNNVYEYKDGKEKEIAHLDDLYIGTVTLIQNDMVLITSDSDMCLMGECELISYRLNLDNFELKEDKNNDKLYAYVHYIK